MIDADLGGGVIKQRVARPNEGRSGGFRTLIFFRVARYLNVSPSVVSQWERGQRSPGGAALKLLNVIKKKGLECLL